MHPVVETKTEPLQLLVIGKAQAVADHMADRLADVVVQHGEDAAQDARAEQHESDGEQRRLGLFLAGPAAGQEAVGVVHRLAQELRDEKLEIGGDDGGEKRGGDAPWMLERQANDAQQRPRRPQRGTIGGQNSTIPAAVHLGSGVAARRRGCVCVHP